MNSEFQKNHLLKDYYLSKQVISIPLMDITGTRATLHDYNYYFTNVNVGLGASSTHGVLSGGAVARVTASPLEKLVTTDSIMATEAVRVAHNVEQLTIAPLIAEAMQRISLEKSVSSLFD